MVAPLTEAPATHVDQHRRVVRFLGWVKSGQCIIEDRESAGSLVSMEMNPVQEKIGKAMMLISATCPRCFEQVKGRDPVCWACTNKHAHSSGRVQLVYRGLPIRIIIPKARKMGVSTFIQAWFVFCTANYPGYQARTLAHTTDSTRDIFKIAKIIAAKKYTTPKMGGHNVIYGAEGAMYSAMTAGGHFVGSGGTPLGVHVSEMAKLLRGLRSEQPIDKQMMDSMLQSMPKTAHTSFFIESTGTGPHGEFYRLCHAARRNKGLTGFYLLFFPWFDDPRYSKALPDNFSLSRDEQRVRDEIEEDMRATLTDEQMYWRQLAMEERGAKIGSMEEVGFKREFPNNFNDCFTALEGRVYPRLSEERHCAVPEGGLERFKNAGYEDRGKIGLCRACDVGMSGEHMFVVLWIAYDNTAMPALYIDPEDPGCKLLLDEMTIYSWDPKTDRPQKQFDHGPDALRYAVTTLGLCGTVYVYRALYIQGATNWRPEDIGHRIHEMSGYTFPAGADQAILKLYEEGDEHYSHNIIDRSARQMQSALMSWGMTWIPHIRPEKLTKTRDEVRDGIGLVQSLISGTAWIIPPPSNERQERLAAILRSMQTGLGRPRQLSQDENDLLREEQAKFARRDGNGKSVRRPRRRRF